jgi:hypothetical protein
MISSGYPFHSASPYRLWFAYSPVGQPRGTPPALSFGLGPRRWGGLMLDWALVFCFVPHQFPRSFSGIYPVLVLLSVKKR